MPIRQPELCDEARVMVGVHFRVQPLWETPIACQAWNQLAALAETRAAALTHSPQVLSRHERSRK